jgi:hypothetical protein
MITENLHVTSVSPLQKFPTWENESVCSEKEFSWDRWEVGLES